MINKLCLAAASCLLFFLVLEGLSGILFVALELQSPNRTASPPPAVQYDPELGWVGVPNYHQESYFAPGVGLRTNSKGLRANEEFAQTIPPGRVRVICSGDSFTFGEGVGNDQTWCEGLEQLDPRLQVVNMGQSAYGIDQMYLWYKREGAGLRHDVHLFAFITDDLRRLQLTHLGGYAKPRLKLENGRLAIENVPVPRPSVPRWLGRLRSLGEFRTLATFSKLARWVLPAPPSALSSGPTSEQRQILRTLVEDLQAINAGKNSVLVLIWLPTLAYNYEQDPAVAKWREFIRSEAAEIGIPFIDLVEEFHEMPVTTRDAMFIWPGSVHHRAEGIGHYVDQGHGWVAREIHSKLKAVPGVREKLSLSPNGTAPDPAAHMAGGQALSK